MTPARIASKASIGSPSGLAGVFSISGGTAPMSTRLRDPRGAVPADVPGDFAAAGGVPDMDRVSQIEGAGERRQVFGVGVHFIAIPGLARPAVAAAIVRDTAETPVGEKHHLRVPRIRGERPAVAEHDRLPRSPVLEVNLGAVLGLDCHAALPLQKMKIPADNEWRTAILDVEGEVFAGSMGLSRVQRVKSGDVWTFDRAARAGMLP